MSPKLHYFLRRASPGSPALARTDTSSFMAGAEGKIQAHIFRADADGANVKELTSGNGTRSPSLLLEPGVPIGDHNDLGLILLAARVNEETSVGGNRKGLTGLRHIFRISTKQNSGGPYG